MKMTDTERWNTALMIAIENLEDPDPQTREKAAFSEVTVEFFEIRKLLMQYAHTMLAFDRSEA